MLYRVLLSAGDIVLLYMGICTEKERERWWKSECWVGCMLYSSYCKSNMIMYNSNREAPVYRE